MGPSCFISPAKSYFSDGLLIFTLAASAWAQGVGSGTLTVDNNNTTCSPSTLGGFVTFKSPNHWDVQPGTAIHVNISPGFNICTAGKLNNRCSGDADCNV